MALSRSPTRDSRTPECEVRQLCGRPSPGVDAQRADSDECSWRGADSDGTFVVGRSNERSFHTMT
jgi:hypothetical protein